MFSNNIKSFIIINLYLLIIVDIALMLSIYYQIIIDKIKNYKYEKVLIHLTPKILAYIKNERERLQVEKLLKTDFIQNIAIDIMVDYSEKNNIDISKKFIRLKLDTILMKKIQKKSSIVYIRKLAFMRAVTAYETLLEFTESEDLDISYISFFGLSLIKLPMYKTKIVIKKLVISDIARDRIIEILSGYNLKFKKWLELLEKAETNQEKVIFLKNIMLKDEIKNVESSDRIQKFLNGGKEVKIATIHALSNSRNEKYIDELIKVYENEENWEVRVAVAKGLSNFKLERVKGTLLKMTKDTEWWVRYNAIKSIVAMGDEGLFTLIDLSLDVEDKNVSDLAYYFLNSNKDVYNTVKNIEV
ncbi:MAG: hypothetical protein ACI8WT_002925 [Clostridium sp.]|jgi:hypothetical protein